MITNRGLASDEGGIVGLWSGNSASTDQNEMFMTQLKADSDIAEKTFSFYMTGLNGQSYLDFGTPNASVMNGSVAYMDILSENNWWSQNLTGFRWHEASSSMVGDATEYALTAAPEALTDTGSSCIFGPSSEIFPIRNTILNLLPSIQDAIGWDYIFQCPGNINDLPVFEFLYGGYWMQIRPEDYILDVSAEEDGIYCTICLLASDSYGKWILGDAFLRGWYSIHDYENLRMGFVPFNGSKKSEPELAGSTPTALLSPVTLTNVDNSFTILGIDANLFLAIWLTFIVTMFIFVLVLVLCYVVAFFSFTAKVPGFKAAKSKRTSLKNTDSVSAIEISLVLLD